MQVDGTVPKQNPQASLENDEDLVGLLVPVPDELAMHLRELECESFI
jgi:hypothetical protein